MSVLTRSILEARQFLDLGKEDYFKHTRRLQGSFSPPPAQSCEQVDAGLGLQAVPYGFEDIFSGHEHPPSSGLIVFPTPNQLLRSLKMGSPQTSQASHSDTATFIEFG
jgi:hypothetical protein